VSDAERAEKAVMGIVGKRLTYRRISDRPEAPSWGNRKLRKLLRFILDEC
jgi:hypothetical protein